MGYYRLPEGYEKTVEAFAAEHVRFSNGGLTSEDFKKLCPPLGIYEQKTAGTYMQRVRLAGGLITPDLLKSLLTLAGEYAEGFLHITTRQNVQFHGVDEKNLAILQQELAKLNLLTQTAGGNCVRNVLIDPLSGTSPDDVFDVTPWGLELSNRLPENRLFATLPRKFKIALSSSKADRALAAIADLGLIAKEKDGVQGFSVYTGGGLGVSSRIGHEIFEFLPAEDILIAATVFNKVFDEYGRDVPRNQSRLRFLIERLGAAEFKRLAEEKFAELKDDVSLKIILAELPVVGDAPDADAETTPFVIRQRQKNRYTVKIPLFFGNISAETGDKIAEFASKYPETEIRFTQTQNILLKNILASALKEAKELGESISDLTKLNGFISDVKTCAGADFCRLSITRSSALHKAIIDAVTAEAELKDVEGINVGISGCPNGCGHTVISDIGFSGRLSKGKEAYKIYLGGSAEELGKEAGELEAEKIPQFFVEFLREFKNSGFTDFRLFLGTDGIDKAKEIIRDSSLHSE